MNKTPERNHTRLNTYINDYLQTLAALNYSPKSIISYKHALARFSSFLTAKNRDRVQDVTVNDLDTYRLELVDQDYSSQSISLYLRAVKKLFSHLEQHQHIFINPALTVHIPKVKTKIKPVPTEEDMNTLLSMPDLSTLTGVRDRAIIETFYSTGLRLEELTRMKIVDTDLNQGRAKVMGKGSKQRVVPLGKKAIHWIEKYLHDVRPAFLRETPDDHALWLGAMGRRINPLTIERFVSDYGKKANIPHPVTPHALRRACATHMLRGGAHPVTIQMLLGHASLKTLSHYLAVTIIDMKKTHGKGNPGK